MEDKRLGLLVGVDGSPSSTAALDWAMAEAAQLHRPVTVCVVAATGLAADVPLPQTVWEDVERSARRLVDRVVTRARAGTPEVTVSGAVATGLPADELRRLAADADQVVLGSRGLGGFERLLLGSVAAQVGAHAPCTVTVVRDVPRTGRAVLIGVDGSRHGDRALEYGFGYAERHGLPVHALHAHPVTLLPAAMTTTAWVPVADLRETAADVLRSAVDPWRAKYPSVPTELTTVQAAAASALRAASAGSTVLVVGSRGHGGFTGMLLGSVSMAMLRHSSCPVVVAR